MRKLCFSVLACLALALPSPAQNLVLEEYLLRGDLAGGQKAVEARLREFPKRPDVRFQLGLAQLLSAVERYSQEMHRLGLKDDVFMGMVPFLRFPVPSNPQPAAATNKAVRDAIDRFARDLAEVGKTLAEIPDSWTGKVPLQLGKVRLDFDGDGKVGDGEELWRILDGINPSWTIDEEAARGFIVHLDAGDARWLEGYCHVLMGIADVGMAYDTQRLFDHTGHLFFRDPASPYPFLKLPVDESSMFEVFADVATFIHLLDLPLVEPGRMTSALEHFRQVAPLSRRSWSCIGTETDDSFEWIPNPKQTSVTGWKVTAEMISEWHVFLDQAEALLEGKKLAPFWRNDAAGRGLNLNRVFTQPPRELDAVLWAQGTGAVPYLEEGEQLSPEIWRRLEGAFNGQFFGFAVWFN